MPTLILGVVMTAIGSLAAYNFGKTDGHKEALRTAYRTNPPSEQLEMTCLGLWIGEQNKKAWEKENASKSK